MPLFASVVTLALAIGRAGSSSGRSVPAGCARPALAGAGACSALALVVAVVPLDTTPYWMQSARAAALAPVDSVAELPCGDDHHDHDVDDHPTPAPASTTTTTLAPTTTTTVDPYAVPALPATTSRPVRIVVIGDSTAMATAGACSRGRDHPDVAQVAVARRPGCGFVRGGHTTSTRSPSYGRSASTWSRNDCRRRSSTLQPDVVVAMVTIGDTEDRVWDDGERLLPGTDPRFAERLIADYDAATTAFAAAGVDRVRGCCRRLPAHAVARRGALRRCGAALAEVVARHPGRAAVVDLAAGWRGSRRCPSGPTACTGRRRPPPRLAADYLGPVVVAAAVT